MNNETLMTDKKKFTDKEGNKLYFVQFVEPKSIICWKEEGRNSSRCLVKNVSHVSVDELKELEIWEKLNSEVQALVQIGNVMVTQPIKTGKRGRPTLFPDFPKELTCVKCGHVQKVQASALAKRIQGLNMTIKEFVAQYQCQTCHPTKGNRKSEYKNVPTTLTCKCGATHDYQRSIVAKMAEKRNLTVEEFISQYQCQKCHPTRGRPKGSKNRVKTAEPTEQKPEPTEQKPEPTEQKPETPVIVAKKKPTKTERAALLKQLSLLPSMNQTT